MRRMARRDLGRDQGGQTTVFVALSAMVLICFLAVMVNVGQLLHDRMLIQTAADMVALSAANVQAAGHNEIADLNIEVQKLVDDLLLDIGFPYKIWRSRGEAERVIQYYDSWIRRTHEEQNRASRVFAQGARQIAFQVLGWFNQQYGQGGYPERQRLPGRQPYGMTELIHATYPGTTFSDLAPYPVEVNYLYLQPVWPPPPPIPCWIWLGGPGYPEGLGRHMTFLAESSGIVLMGSHTINGRVRKDVEKQTYYRVRLSRPPVKPYVNLPEYGFDVRQPALEAYALAQPTGGSIQGLNPNYRARFMPLRTRYTYDVDFPNRDKFRH